jgi:hypothetical protein
LLCRRLKRASIVDEQNLGAALTDWVHPDFTSTPHNHEIGFIHRHLAQGELYFLANTGNSRQNFRGGFRSSGAHAEVWDPFTGKAIGLQDSTELTFDLEPYESRIVFFSNSDLTKAAAKRAGESIRADLSRDWSVTFEGREQPLEMRTLTSWGDDARMRFYSGTATYRKIVDIAEETISSGSGSALDFGEGVKVAKPDPLPKANMRAYLESPVRESAQVYVNDQFAGYVWHPPYRVDISPYLKAGRNELRIVVGNTAINELAGESQPDYRLLRDRYGLLFDPQGMENLEPLPSGILGKVTLIQAIQGHP